MYEVTVNWLALRQWIETFEEAEKWFDFYRDKYPYAMIEIRNSDCPYPYKTSFEKGGKIFFNERYFPPKERA